MGGSDATAGAMCGPRSGRISRVYFGERNYIPGQWNVLADLTGPGLITHIWVTFPKRDVCLGRRVLLRCYWDDEPEPSVEAPIGDFFGVPFGLSGAELRLDTQWLTVVPVNGLNSYFPMPFASRARMEVLPAEPVSAGGFYVQIDYVLTGDTLPVEWAGLRFHAQFRFENPCEQYGRNYLFLDASGRGRLVGVTMGISMRYPQPDAWYHGGGDTMLIDGEERPAVLHGIGAEDFFGHAWGVQPSHARYMGTPYEELDAEGRPARLALYRFFEKDPLYFSRSLRASLGALGNAYSSVAYWYQQEPHVPFFRTPAADARMPDAQAVYGTYDVEAEPPETWSILAPFPCGPDQPFDSPRSFEACETGDECYAYRPGGLGDGVRATLPGGETMMVRWRTLSAQHGFVDLNQVARPALACICLQMGVVGYALRYVESDSDREATCELGFDDLAAVWVNGEQRYRGSHLHGFESERFGVRLRKGRNRILVKLSNEDNDNWRFWGFCLRVAQAAAE